MNVTSLLGVRDAIASGRTSATAVVREAIARARGEQERLNAFLEFSEARAVMRAKAIDRALESGGDPRPGMSGPLLGVPIAVKDNLCVGPDAWPGSEDLGGPTPTGGRTTCASRLLGGYESPYTATVVRRLVDAGAVVIAKTNLDEFAMGSSGENSAFGPTRNPHDPARVPGGSSSGSAAAVASGAVTLALGSDTGGSIRQPAALCGIVGLKPTYGRVSRYGLVAYASSLDQVGPMTRSVADAALALSVMCGRCAHDATSADRPAEDFSAQLHTPVEGLVVGVPRQARSPANHPAVSAALERVAAGLARAGASVVEVDLPHADFGIAAYYLVATAEASSNLARFDGVRYGRRAALAPGEGLAELYARSRAEGFGPEVRRRILLGTYVLSAGYYDAYYNTALKTRRKIKDDFDRAFGIVGGGPACHALLTPTAPSPAFRLGEKTTDPLQMYLEDVYTVGVNLAGLPAISVPAGWAEVEASRLPVGVQLIGPAFDEARLLRVARMVERLSEA